MFRILGIISIYGTKASLAGLVSNSAIPLGTLKQIGTKRKVPDIDSWCYSSPYYRFREIITLDEEVFDFLIAHERLKDYLDINDDGIEYAIFTLCPVDQSYEETFSCLLSQKTLKILVDLGLSLEISPASVMPDVDYWKPINS